MNRIWIVVLLLIFFTKNGYSQKLDFMDTSNKWRVSTFFTPLSPPILRYWQYEYLRHTIFLKGHEYNIIVGGLNDSFFVRKDSLTGAIYAMVPANTYTDSTDRLLYDFKMSKGDTYTHYIRTYDNSKMQFIYDTTRYVVLETDSVLINGLLHRVQYISSVGTFFKRRYVFTVIEGIGSISGMTWPLHYSNRYYDDETTDCFYNRHGIPVLAQPVIAKHFLSDTTSNYYALDTFDNSCPPKLSILQTTIPDNQIAIYPQPAKSHVIINWRTRIADGRIVIINIQGQIIMDKAIANEERINLRIEQPPGIYAYKIIDHIKGTQFTGKIIIK